MEITELETKRLFLFWQKSPFSQWADLDIVENDITYATAEHWMMAKKAALFGDNDSRRHVLCAPTPKAAKALGRQVKNFDEGVWQQHRYRIVVEGNLLKFTQHPEAQQALLATSDAVLVEASPYDRIWGIGLGPDDPRAQHPSQWLGLNLLGFALTEVKKQLTMGQGRN